MMSQKTNRTFICSVLFMDIVEYSRKSVEEQIWLKERFNALLSETIKDIAVNDRIILDTGDGAAIGFLGDPEDALFVGMGLRDSILNEQSDSSLPLSIRMGINLGPVKLVTDINKQLNLIGDGINVAQRVLSFAQPGQIVVSRSYYEVISRLSQEYAKLFHYQGLHADKHIREYEIYDVGHYGQAITPETNEATSGDPPQPDQSQSIPDQASGHDGEISAFATVAQRSFHKKWLYAAIPLAIIIILFVAILLYRGRDQAKHPAVVTVPHPQPTVAVTSPTPAIPVTPLASPNTKDTEDHKPTARPKVSTNLSSIYFRILPWGEIYINGKKRGASPPLTSVRLKPGKYRIEIKNSSFPIYSKTVEVKSNDSIKIKHKFH